MGVSGFFVSSLRSLILECSSSNFKALFLTSDYESKDTGERHHESEDQQTTLGIACGEIMVMTPF